MIKLYCRIFMSYNNLFTNFFTYIKMSKKSSAKYYQGNKKRLQNKFVRDIKIFLRKKKKKSDNMVVNDTKICLKIKNKSLVEY